MKSIAQLLESKGAEVWSIGSDASVFEALGMMADKDVGALLVVDDGALKGILSERDYARKVILMGHTSRQTRVWEIMTPQVHCIAPGRSVADGLALMTERHIRHLPVMDNGKVLGLVSIGDLVKEIIAEQRFEIEQLEQYIAG